MLLFSPELKVTTLLSWTFFFANAFTYYGLVLLTTQLPYKSYDDLSTVKVACLPDGKPGTDVSSYKAVLITCLAELPGLLVACLIVERFGRKASLGALLFACGFFVIPLWTPLSQVATNTLMFGARSCIMGAFSILWAFAPELYPTKVRSTGLGFCNSGGRVGGFLCPFVAVGLMESGHRVCLGSRFLSLWPFIAVGLMASGHSVWLGPFTFFRVWCRFLSIWGILSCCAYMAIWQILEICYFVGLYAANGNAQVAQSGPDWMSCGIQLHLTLWFVCYHRCSLWLCFL